MKDSRKWARLFVCLAFHMILAGLASAILSHIFGVARPGKILFLPSLAAAAVVGVFYTWDREGSRVAEAGNLAGALVAFHLWADLTYPPEGAGPWAVLSGWPVWGSYLANTLAILAAGWFAERRRG